MRGSLYKIGLVVSAFVLGFFLSSWLTRGGRSEANLAEHDRGVAPTAITASPDAKLQPDIGLGFDGLVAGMRRLDALVSTGRHRALLESGVFEESYPVLMDWAEEDPAALWAWLQGGGKEKVVGFNVEREVLANWFPRDPEAAMEALRGLTIDCSSTGQSAVIALLFGDDAGVSAQVAERFEELAAMSDNEHAWPDSGVDPDHIEIVRSLPPSMARDQLVHNMAKVYFSNDWKSALDWAGSLPDADRRQVELAFIEGATYWSKGDESGESKLAWARDWLTQEGNRPSLARHGQSIAMKMAEADPAAALEWAGANLDGKALASATRLVIRQSSNREPAEAIGLIERLPLGGIRRGAIGWVMGDYAEADPRAAFAWAVEEDSQVQPIETRTWETLGGTIGYHDTEFAREMLGDSESALDPNLLNSTLRELVSNGPGETLEWAQSIGGERGEALQESALDMWRKRDAEAAQAWEDAR